MWRRATYSGRRRADKPGARALASRQGSTRGVRVGSRGRPGREALPVSGVGPVEPGEGTRAWVKPGEGTRAGGARTRRRSPAATSRRTARGHVRPPSPYRSRGGGGRRRPLGRRLLVHNPTRARAPRAVPLPGRRCPLSGTGDTGRRRREQDIRLRAGTESALRPSGHRRGDAPAVRGDFPGHGPVRSVPDRRDDARKIVVTMCVTECGKVPENAGPLSLDVTLRNTRAMEEHSFILGERCAQDPSSAPQVACSNDPASSPKA